MRRRQLREEFLPPDSDSDTAEDEAESPPRSPSPPPPPRKRESVKIVIDETPASEEDSETEAFNRSLDRAPSAKSVVVASPASAAASRGHHVNRVKDKFRPSVVAAAGLNKEAAAARLHRALHDSPTDVDTVIEVLTSHSHDQRKKIAKAYKFNHSKVSMLLTFRLRIFTYCQNSQLLRSDLEHNLRGDTRKLLTSLVVDDGEFYAEALRSQVDGSFRCLS